MKTVNSEGLASLTLLDPRRVKISWAQQLVNNFFHNNIILTDRMNAIKNREKDFHQQNICINTDME